MKNSIFSFHFLDQSVRGHPKLEPFGFAGAVWCPDRCLNNLVQHDGYMPEWLSKNVDGDLLEWTPRILATAVATSSPVGLFTNCVYKLLIETFWLANGNARLCFLPLK